MRTTYSSRTATPDVDTRRGQALRAVAAAVAAVFVVVGIAGFVPGITTNFDNLELWDHHDTADPAELLGIFHVSVLHNVVHLLFGVGLLLARTVRGAAIFLLGGGLTYAVVFVYGILVEQDSKWNFLPLNDADNWLHAGLAVAMIGLGLALTPRDVGKTEASATGRRS